MGQGPPCRVLLGLGGLGVGVGHNNPYSPGQNSSKPWVGTDCCVGLAGQVRHEVLLKAQFGRDLTVLPMVAAGSQGLFPCPR